MTTIVLESDPRAILLLESIDRKLDLLLGDGSEKIYSLKEAAALLGISYHSAFQRVQEGELRYIDRGRGKQKISYGIPESAIDEFKTARTREGGVL